MGLKITEKQDSFLLRGTVGEETVMESINSQYFVKKHNNHFVEGHFGIYDSWQHRIFSAGTKEKAMDCAYGIVALEADALLDLYPKTKVEETLRNGRESRLVENTLLQISKHNNA